MRTEAEYGGKASSIRKDPFPLKRFANTLAKPKLAYAAAEFKVHPHGQLPQNRRPNTTIRLIDRLFSSRSRG